MSAVSTGGMHSLFWLASTRTVSNSSRSSASSRALRLDLSADSATASSSQGRRRNQCFSSFVPTGDRQKELEQSLERPWHSQHADTRHQWAAALHVDLSADSPTASSTQCNRKHHVVPAPGPVAPQVISLELPQSGWIEATLRPTLKHKSGRRHSLQRFRPRSSRTAHQETIPQPRRCC